MMKILPFILTIALLSGCTISFTEDSLITDQHLSLDVIKNEVTRFLDGIPETKNCPTNVHRSISSVWCTSTNTKADNQGAKLYVLNFADSLGYAIASDEPHLGILGVALKGTLEECTTIENPGLFIILSNAESLLDYPDTAGMDLPVVTYEYGNWTDAYFAPEDGYCPVKWGQDSPYNQYCHTLEERPAKTGCVATAIAQLMSIYKYPTFYSSYSFDWDNMINDPYSSDDDNNNSVGILMRQLGTYSNLNMYYDEDESSANPENISRTLQNFGYSCGGVLNPYSQNTVINELRSGFPILMGGSCTRITTINRNIFGSITSTSYDYGDSHRWLGHGLLTRTRTINRFDDGAYVGSTIEQRHYILCNFGWEGNDDGYYSELLFNTNNGPVYPDPIATRSSSSTIEHYPGEFRFNINVVTGIRK